MVFLNIVELILREGFLYAILALGVYITYSILDFPDLSVDGAVPLGAVVTGVLISAGVNPWLCCLIAFAAGAAAGCVTGLLNVKLHIRPLLCGILTMTALLSFNLVICKAGTDGMSIVSFFAQPTIFSSGPAAWIPETVGDLAIRRVVVLLVLVAACKLLLDLYLKSKSGLLLRATGSNDQYVILLARDPGLSKILGLALGNGFAALSGSVIAQSKGTADLNMGTGMVVIGLASVIIGLSIFRKVRFMRFTTMVVIGSLLYKTCLQVAMSFGLNPDYLKAAMAVIFVAALVLSHVTEKGKRGVPHAKA